MPSCLAECMRTQDLRLLHCALKVARVRLQQWFSSFADQDDDLKKCLQLIQQAEALATSQMQLNNIVPALSAAELRDELLPDDEIPAF